MAEWENVFSAQTKRNESSSTPSTSKLMAMAKSRIVSISGTRAEIYLGPVKDGQRPLRIVSINKDASGRPRCSLRIGEIMEDGVLKSAGAEEVRIDGSRDRRPIVEPDLPFPIYKLADALICWLQFPHEANQMLMSRPKTE